MGAPEQLAELEDDDRHRDAQGHCNRPSAEQQDEGTDHEAPGSGGEPFGERSPLRAYRVETTACLVEFQTSVDEVGDELVHRGELRKMRGLTAVDPHHREQTSVRGRVVHDEGVRGQIDLDGGQSARGAGGDDGDLDIAGAGSGAHHHRRDIGGEVEDHPGFVFARLLRLHGRLVRGAFERGDDRHRLRVLRRTGDEFADGAPGDLLGDALRRTAVVGAGLRPSAAASGLRGLRCRGLRYIFRLGFR